MIHVKHIKPACADPITQMGLPQSQRSPALYRCQHCGKTIGLLFFVCAPVRLAVLADKVRYGDGHETHTAELKGYVVVGDALVEIFGRRRRPVAGAVARSGAWRPGVRSVQNPLRLRAGIATAAARGGSDRPPRPQSCSASCRPCHPNCGSAGGLPRRPAFPSAGSWRRFSERQRTILCQSVSSFHSPVCWSFQRRFVASVKLEPETPQGVNLVSASLPRCPISMTLLTLRDAILS